MRRFEVRDADRAERAILEQRKEPLPRIHVAILLRVRPVDQEEVDVREAEALGAVREGLSCLILAVPALVELRRDEDLVAVHAARSDPAPDPGLVPIVLGGVDQPVTVPERGGHDLLGLLLPHRRRAEPEGRHLDAVRERDGGDLVGHRHSMLDGDRDRPDPRPRVVAQLADRPEHEFGLARRHRRRRRPPAPRCRPSQQPSPRGRR